MNKTPGAIRMSRIFQSRNLHFCTFCYAKLRFSVVLPWMIAYELIKPTHYFLLKSINYNPKSWLQSASYKIESEQVWTAHKRTESGSMRVNRLARTHLVIDGLPCLACAQVLFNNARGVCSESGQSQSIFLILKLIFRNDHKPSEAPSQCRHQTSFHSAWLYKVI